MLYTKKQLNDGAKAMVKTFQTFGKAFHDEKIRQQKIRLIEQKTKNQTEKNGQH